MKLKAAPLAVAVSIFLSLKASLLSVGFTTCYRREIDNESTEAIAALGDHHGLTLSSLWLSSQGRHPMQTLVLSSERGIAVAIGTVDFHSCPLPDYNKNDLQLSFEEQAFLPRELHHTMGTAGPLLMAFFNITESLWDQQRHDPSVMKLWNGITKTTQELQVLVDPAARANAPPHFLSAMTTVRKHYRYYRGLGKSENKTESPSTWNASETQSMLTQWMDHHRSMGVSHFYVVDNEPDTSLPNLTISGSGVTYIRAPHMHYDTWNCKRNGYTVSGQSILENSVIRFAHTKWLLICDIDEYVVLADRYDNSLVNFIEYFRSVHCRGVGDNPMESIICRPLHETAHKEVYAISLSSFLMRPDNTIRNEMKFQRKTMLRPELTSRLEVHYPFAFNTSLDAEVSVPPQQGWLAHYNHNLYNATGFKMEELLPRAGIHSPNLRPN